MIELHWIKTIFHFTIAFQCVLFAIFLYSQKRGRNLGIIFLIAFLIAKAIPEFGGMCYHFIGLRIGIIEYIPYFLYLDNPFNLAYVPFLFLFICSKLERGFELKRKHLWHFAPFLLYFLYVIIRLTSFAPHDLREAMHQGVFFSQNVLHLLFFSEQLQFIVYALVAIYKLRQATTSNLDNYTFHFLNFILWGFLLWKSIHLLEYILWAMADWISEFAAYILYIIAECGFLIFVSLLFFKVIKSPRTHLSNGKYQKTLLSDIEKAHIKEQLLLYMREESPHLNPLISLNELAKKINLAPYQLSQTINSIFKQNFFDFINRYRVEESKKLLKKYSAKEKTILDILYASGFNSKSVFNTAFKKNTGMTPSAFRKKHQNHITK